MGDRRVGPCRRHKWVTKSDLKRHHVGRKSHLSCAIVKGGARICRICGSFDIGSYNPRGADDPEEDIKVQVLMRPNQLKNAISSAVGHKQRELLVSEIEDEPC